MVPTTPNLTPRYPRLPPLARDVLIGVACIAACVIYLAASGQAGYPLDDAWIYQTYARNLAMSGQWAFVPGQPSTGSTSILWTLLLTPGYLLPINARTWTLGAGMASLVATALGATRLVGDDGPVWLPLATGLAVGVEWHLVWAATSGMETGFFAALLVWFWVWLRRRDPAQSGRRWQNGLLLGVWGGALMLARPEGVLALAAAGLYGLLVPRQEDSGHIGKRLAWGGLAGAGFALVLVPFFAFNYAASGAIWPNTFYAKQTEYAVLWQRPYPLRLADQVGVTLVGAQVVLVPGLIASVWRRLRRQPAEWIGLAGLGWVVLHWALYAARLPVTYQHGRYAMPAVPLVLAYGLQGTAWLARPRARRVVIRVASLAWLLTAAALVGLVPVVLGAPAYERDVAFIEREMVATAHWVAAAVPADATIAAHDIGALGYYAPRRLIDLAGLVSPDVIPFMDDADRLADYITGSGADYLIVFPHWSAAYEDLVSRPTFEAVWSAAEQAGYTSDSGLGPMTVYRVVGSETGVEP